MFPIQFGHRVQRFDVGLVSTFVASLKTDDFCKLGLAEMVSDG
jgi:hypothetical protein